MLFYNGFAYFNGLDYVCDIKRRDFYLILKISLIPFIGLLYDIHLIRYFLFFQLGVTNVNRDYNVNGIYESNNYATYLRTYYSYRLIIAIFFLNSLLLSICYFLCDFYFKIILLIISLFSKFYPYKYYLGIILYGIRDTNNF